jgi:hypothetical protein
VLRQELEGAFEIRERVRRVYYARHGRGRAARFPLASRSIQA